MLISQPALEVGDIVKIDMGCHIDGYIAVSGHTLICGNTADEVPANVDAETCDVSTAAYNAMLVACSKLVPGGKGSEVTASIAKVAEAYGVVPIFKIRMNQMTRFVIEGTKEIALRDPDVEDEEEEVSVFRLSLLFLLLPVVTFVVTSKPYIYLLTPISISLQTYWMMCDVGRNARSANSKPARFTLLT